MFEAFLRKREIPYVAVDEKKRPVTRYGPIKNFDFLVHSRRGNLTVDIKGKEFPQAAAPGRRGLRWQNWVKAQDLEGMAFWRDIMGKGFTPVIVFAYRVLLLEDIYLFSDLFNYEGQSYGLVAVTFEDYKAHAGIRSRKWEAYSVNKKDFLKIKKPLRCFIPEIAG